MRWFFGIVKILFVLLILAAAVKLFFTYIPGSELSKFAYDLAKGPSSFESSNKTESSGTQENTEQGIAKEAEDGIKNDTLPYSRPLIDEEGKMDNVDSHTKIQENDTRSYKPNEDFISMDEINAAESIGLADKLEALFIFSKVEKSDMDKIFALIKGGITYGEKEVFEQTLLQNIGKEDFEKLNKLLAKNKKLYSEGKLAD
ncbi:MAG: hypothetical protein N3B21_10545 [Clostridia bacterium]|nr:hypothetical protein [Clostridia bacterium]